MDEIIRGFIKSCRTNAGISREIFRSIFELIQKEWGEESALVFKNQLQQTPNGGMYYFPLYDYADYDYATPYLKSGPGIDILGCIEKIEGAKKTQDVMMEDRPQAHVFADSQEELVKGLKELVNILEKPGADSNAIGEVCRGILYDYDYEVYQK